MYTHHLLSYHDNRFGGESPVAVVKEILQARTEQVDHQDVVQTLLAKVIDVRNASCGRVSASLSKLK